MSYVAVNKEIEVRPGVTIYYSAPMSIRFEITMGMHVSLEDIDNGVRPLSRRVIVLNLPSTATLDETANMLEYALNKALLNGSFAGGTLV